MVDLYAIVRRLTGCELITASDTKALTDAVDGLIAELEQVKQERDDAKQALRIATNDKLSLLDQLDQAKNARMAQIDYGCDLQRTIEDLCRGGPIREPKTSARHHYNMATETLARTGAVKEEGAELAKAVFGVDLVAHPRATNPVASHETANVGDNALAEPAGEAKPYETPIAAEDGREVDWVDVTGWGVFKGHAIPVDVARYIATKINLYAEHRTTPPDASAIREALERGQAFANQVRAVTCHLNGQAYSSTVSALNYFDAALSRAALAGAKP